MAEILKPDRKAIEKAVDILKKGGVIAFPTETVYGLGANGLNPVAVAKIFEIKNRPFFDPVILHIAKKLMREQKN
jgi:L-threonylcarbamoyladenylate synthase